jgi:hypothetical protein
MSKKFVLPDNVAISFFREYLSGVPTGRDYHARCPVCGDSSSNKHKKRMYLLKDENWYVYCHNCGYSNGLTWFVKDFFPMQYDRMMEQAMGSFFQLDEFKESEEQQASRVILSLKKKQTHLTSFLKKNCVRLSDIDGILDLNGSDKKVVAEQLKYLKGRKIPKSLYSDFHYCYKISDKKTQFPYKNRIIIPFFKGNDRSPYFFQGRMTNKYHDPKYINWKDPKANAEIKPEYNEFNVNKEETVYIVEGLFDSFFIRNSVSTLGANMSKDRMRYYENKYPNRCYVLDNDKAGIDVLNKLYDRGEKCFLLPKTKKKLDINEIAVKLDTDDLTDLVEKNSYVGLEGVFKLKEYNY